VREHLQQTQWNRVDGSGDASAFVAYLERFEATPMIHGYRQYFCGLLPCRPGDRVLDAGCGIGGNARQLVSQVGASGRIVGLDISRHMARRARAVSPPDRRIAYGVGDLCHLPLTADALDGALCDRVLMHLEDPLQVLKELLRVLRPGGWLGLSEPDWSRVHLVPDDRVGRILLAAHCAAFENGAIGGCLAALVKAAGGRIEAELTQSHALRDFAQLMPLLNLDRTLKRLLDAGQLTMAQVSGWRARLEEAARDGAFCLHMAHTICIAGKAED